MTRRTFLQATSAAALLHGSERKLEAPILKPDQFRHYVDEFNAVFPEEVVNYVPDARTWQWMESNIPLFSCPDRDMEQIYYYRWWVLRKHIKDTPDGFLITEFLKPVKHAGQYNALSCAFGHHIAEARWLHDRKFADGDIHFWLCTGENGGLRKNFHQFSSWAAATVYDKSCVDGDRDFAASNLDALINDYKAWEQERLLDDGLFWQRDVSDGMEVSVSGGRKVKNKRPSINSYMYGNAIAIASIAEAAGRGTVAQEYRGKAAKLKKLVQAALWNTEQSFYETRLESGQLADVREEIGFTPWYFYMPDDREGMSVAWKQLMDPKGFYAPYGPTTVEQRHPGFAIAYEGDDCQWNGPSWPFATTITLKAMANLLCDYHQSAVTKRDYFDILSIYTKSQHLKRPDGKVVPWIDEDLNPFTGEWIARAMKIREGSFYGRGDHYNHSGYCDLIITGLAGLKPRPDRVVEINPLVPTGYWDWFCLDRLSYHGHTLTIIWDKSGRKFGMGKGLQVLADSKRIAQAPALQRITGTLPA